MLPRCLPNCQFCECPLVEGGVYLPEVDVGRLSKWLVRTAGVSIDRVSIDNSWCCLFCVREARYFVVSI